MLVNYNTVIVKKLGYYGHKVHSGYDTKHGGNTKERKTRLRVEYILDVPVISCFFVFKSVMKYLPTYVLI